MFTFKSYYYLFEQKVELVKGLLDFRTGEVNLEVDNWVENCWEDYHLGTFDNRTVDRKKDLESRDN